MNIKIDEKKFKPRRPFWDHDPDGALESDNDFIENNFNLCLEILEKLSGHKEFKIGDVIHYQDPDGIKTGTIVSERKDAYGLEQVTRFGYIIIDLDNGFPIWILEDEIKENE